MYRLKLDDSFAVSRGSVFAIGLASSLIIAINAPGVVIVTPTMDADVLEYALNPVGLSITSVSTLNGAAGQYGTYTNFTTQPITIGNGVVLSSGDVSAVVPPADPSLESPQPSYDMQTPGTAEFDAYGTGHIENFQSSNDVAVLRVDFSLDDSYQIQFDFVFGSVEYPFYTGSFTDSFLVFLDGTDSANQVTYDQNGTPVQVGSSFAGLVSVADQNTAFANPHGVLGLTTTTAELDAGDYTLLFEIGDVNDHILDSAVFIYNLRTGIGEVGTEPTEPEDGDFNFDGVVDAADFVVWRKFYGSQDGYDTWRDHFGERPAGNGSGLGLPSQDAVPEPATFVVLMFAAAGWCPRRNRTY
jgi:hypothetical protein